MESDFDRYLVTEPQLITEVDEEVDEAEILRYLGYPGGQSPPDSVKSLIQRWVDEANRYTASQATFLVLPVAKITTNRLGVRSTALATSESNEAESVETEFRGAIGQFLGFSQLILVYIATAGPRIERLAGQLMAEGDALSAFIVNAVGTERAEAAASAVINRVREQMMAIGLAPTLPYSPGYCGMPLTEQVRLFNLFDGHTVGVTLTPECLMWPIKSVSGIVGLVSRDKIGAESTRCQRCSLESCSMRRS